MRSRIPVVLLLATLVTAGCHDMPTAADGTLADQTSLTLKSDDNNGAVRWIPDPFCAVFDGDGNPVFVDCRNQIATYSSNGNAVVVVHKVGVPNSTGEVLKWDAYHPPQVMLDWYGFDEPPVPCFLYDPDMEPLFTVKWQGMLTPGGTATFTCHYAKQWEFQWPD